MVSWARTGAGALFAYLSVYLLLSALTWGVWTGWGAALLVAAGVWAVAIASLQRGAGYVVELLDGALRIRRADKGWRRLQPARIVRAASVEDGYATPTDVVLRLRGNASIRLELASDHAREVLDHLGIGLERRTLSAPLSGAFNPSAWLGLIMMLVVVVGAAAGIHHLLEPRVGLALLGVVALAYMIVSSRRLKPHLVVGLDGVRVAGVVRSRFVPYRDIERVRRTGEERRRIVLETSGGVVVLSCIESSEEEVDALVARIEEGRARATAGHAPPLDQLDRRGRALQAWLGALRELALGEKGFRGAALSDDDLDDVLSDPEAPLERRLGAALILRARGSDARDRIRVAAATSAERRVRVALEAAAADEVDHDALERALDEAHPPRPGATAE